jgi:hypothetical protein
VTKKLIALRRDTPALHSREWSALIVDPATPLFAYLRTTNNGKAPVVVLLNFSATEVEAVAVLPHDTATSFSDEDLIDLWSEETIQAFSGGQVNDSVPRWGFRFLTPGNVV